MGNIWDNITENLIVTKTPLRVSFVGGGTDFYDYWNIFNGQVISFSINKYIYTSLKRHSKFHNEKIRLNYSENELVNNPNELKNIVARGCLNYFNIETPLYIATVSDIPSGSGLGSSSSFMVGLVNAFFQSVNEPIGPGKLAYFANQIEIEYLKRPMGKQDAYPASYGGLNHLFFNKNGDTSITPIILEENNFKILNSSLYLVSTNQIRDSSIVLENQSLNNKNNFNDDNLHLINALVDKFLNCLKYKFDLNEIGKILTETWEIKKKLSNLISTSAIDKLFDKCIDSGAYGGKICGAGSGGFILCIVNPQNTENFTEKIKPNKYLKIEIDNLGSRRL